MTCCPQGPERGFHMPGSGLSVGATSLSSVCPERGVGKS